MSFTYTLPALAVSPAPCSLESSPGLTVIAAGGRCCTPGRARVPLEYVYESMCFGPKRRNDEQCK